MKNSIINLLKDNLPEFYSEGVDGENEAYLNALKRQYFPLNYP